MDLTDEAIVFNKGWDCRLTELAIYNIGLEELVSLYEVKAGQLREMIDTGVVDIIGDFPEWDVCPDLAEPLFLSTYDPHVAAQFHFTDVLWLSREEPYFDVYWGENGAATFEGVDGELIPVQLWQEESGLDQTALASACT